jgi:hypothetical protein
LPDQEDDFEAHAYHSFADMAHSYHLCPGDRALMRGTLQQQTIELVNADRTIVNHFFVTAIEVLARSKRTSIFSVNKLCKRVFQQAGFIDGAYSHIGVI